MTIEPEGSPHEQVPSSTQMVKFFQVNHLTVLKGMNLLMDKEITYKKRGVGMFVSADARRLGIAWGELSSVVSQAEEEDQNHDDEHRDA